MDSLSISINNNAQDIQTRITYNAYSTAPCKDGVIINYAIELDYKPKASAEVPKSAILGQYRSCTAPATN